MKRTYSPLMLCILLGSGLTLGSCVDKNYDMQNLDMTMQTGSGARLTLPTSSTGEIRLGSIFDLADGSAVQEIASLYYLNTVGEAEQSHIKIDVIDIKKPNPLHFEAQLAWAKNVPSTSASARRRAPRDGALFSYQIDQYAYAKIQNAKANDISEDLLSIERIGFKPTTIELYVGIYSDYVDIFKNIHFDELQLHLPTGLHVTSCKFEGKEVLTTEDQKNKARTQGIIDISELLTAQGESTDYDPRSILPLTLSLTFDQADVTTTTNAPGSKGAFFNPEQHTAELVGDIKLHGYAYGNLADIDEDEVETIILEKILAGDFGTDFASKTLEEKIHALVPTLDFIGNGDFSSNIEVNEFTGKAQHEVTDIKPIQLNDLPTWLVNDENTPKNERIQLDLDNPQVFLELSVVSSNFLETGNTFDQTIKTGVELNAYQNGKTDPTATVNTGELTFDAPDGEPIFTILKRIYANENITKDQTPMPEDYDEDDRKGMEDVLVPSLKNLLMEVPNRIEVKGHNSDNIMVDIDCQNFRLPQDLLVNVGYQVFTPLTFGKDFRIVYTGTEGDWAKDLTDAEDLDFGGLELTATVVSTLPLPVEFTVIPLAPDGTEINSGDTKLQVSTLSIPANAKDGHPIAISLLPAEGYTMRDFIRGKNSQGQPVPKLDGIRYKAVLSGSQQSSGQSLGTEQMLMLKDIRATLVGGVTYFDKE